MDKLIGFEDLLAAVEDSAADSSTEQRGNVVIHIRVNGQACDIDPALDSKTHNPGNGYDEGEKSNQNSLCRKLAMNSVHFKTVPVGRIVFFLHVAAEHFVFSICFHKGGLGHHNGVCFPFNKQTDIGLSNDRRNYGGHERRCVVYVLFILELELSGIRMDELQISFFFATIDFGNHNIVQYQARQAEYSKKDTHRRVGDSDVCGTQDADERHYNAEGPKVSSQVQCVIENCVAHNERGQQNGQYSRKQNCLCLHKTAPSF